MNGIGISDSGGVTVLEKLLKECLEAGKNNEFIIVLTSSDLRESLVARYRRYNMFSFRTLSFKNYAHRLYYENSAFKTVIVQYGIDLVYNMSGTVQFFLECPHLVKVHNLLFYSNFGVTRYCFLCIIILSGSFVLGILSCLTIFGDFYVLRAF